MHSVALQVTMDRESMPTDFIERATHDCLSVRALLLIVGVRQAARKDLPSDS